MTWNQQWSRSVRYPTQSVQPPATVQQPIHVPRQSAAAATSQASGAAQQPSTQSQARPQQQPQQQSQAQPQRPQTQLQLSEGGVQHPAASVPATDVVETQSEIVVHVDAPGFDTDQLHVHADENRLYVTGDRSEDVTFEAGGSERPLSAERPLRIERTIPLPIQIDPDQATASHENGVCEITIPKGETTTHNEIGFQ